MDLFTVQPKPPLAELLRPRCLADVVGQAHLIGPGKPLRMAFDAKKLHSFVLWGPPGVGKTTLARLAADVTDSQFISLSAVRAGVKELREVIDSAQMVLDQRNRQTIVFIDEVHAFSKSQQDTLLPHLESGLLQMVAGTTQHPGLSLNGALQSRMQVYSLEPLVASDFHKLYERATPHLDGVRVNDQGLELLTAYADGDARRFLNLIEIVAVAAKSVKASVATLEFVKQSTSPSLRRFDAGGDETYTQLSAFHKSIRGSQPNAALYWLARMLDGGGDPRHVARRMVVIASEDIGNADPRALQLAIDAAEVCDRIGLPEAELALAQAATYLAMAPKSNASYLAWAKAKSFVQSDGSRPVPLHLRNAPTQLMEQMGYKKGYRYAHDEPDAYAAGQTYFPDGVSEQDWYQPTSRGFDAKLAEKLDRLKELDARARDLRKV